MRCRARYLGGDLPLASRAAGRLALRGGQLAFTRFWRRRWSAAAAAVVRCEVADRERVLHLVPWAMNYRHSGLFGDEQRAPFLYLRVAEDGRPAAEALFETAAAAEFCRLLKAPAAGAPPAPGAGLPG